MNPPVDRPYAGMLFYNDEGSESLSDTDATGNWRRVVIGHDKEGVASVSLMDCNGRKRILLQVARDGTPGISFLDAHGRVVSSDPRGPNERIELLYGFPQTRGKRSSGAPKPGRSVPCA
jgi:hypothetical protein